MPRTISIGDVHGCSTALSQLIIAIDPQRDDTLVMLGDYVDRGIDSKGVLDQLIELQSRLNLVPLLGNHEEILLNARESRSNLDFFLACGGIATLDSYGSSGKLSLIPERHWTFLKSCRSYFETDRHLFLHANYKPDVPVDELDTQTLRWLSLWDYVPAAQHCSGKIAIVGHTPQTSGFILDLGYLKCIDTSCCNGGWLTALDVETGQLWQVSERGELKSDRDAAVSCE